MSTEIMNKTSVDLANSVAVAAQTARVQPRQDLTSVSGNGLPPEQNQISKEELQNVVKRLNEHVQNINRDLQFSVDEESGRQVIKVVNAETQELVRQIPSEEVLRISRHIKELSSDASGLIFQTSV